MAVLGKPVAHVYAGILGLLALVTSLADGLIHSRDTETILFGAWLSLLVFAAFGYLAGWIAERIVDESVRSQVTAELALRAAEDGSGE